MADDDKVNTPAGDGLDEFKGYLAEPRFRIRLDDVVSTAVQAAIQNTTGDTFPLSTANLTGADFAARLAAYENGVRPLLAKATLLGKWATAEQLGTLTNLVARMADACAGTAGGNTLWLDLRWHPLSALLYSAGIGAISAGNYPALKAILTTPVRARTRKGEADAAELVVAVVDAMLGVIQTDVWKALPQYKDKYTPESEHMFTFLRPVMDEVVFLGGGYDLLFDQYEILRALVYCDFTDDSWGPIGRFGWKHSGRLSDGSPYIRLRKEADRARDRWGPISAGLFGGSYERFNAVAGKFEKGPLNRVNFR